MYLWIINNNPFAFSTEPLECGHKVEDPKNWYRLPKDLVIETFELAQTCLIKDGTKIQPKEYRQG